jgi:hypothetical protein
VAATSAGSPPNTEIYVTSGNTHTVLIFAYRPCPTVVAWCPTAAMGTGGDEPGPVVAGPDRVWVGTYGANAGKVYDINHSSPAMTNNYDFMIDRPTALAGQLWHKW